MRLRSRGSEFEQSFGGQPMTLSRAVGAAFLEPQKISNLADAIAAISYCFSFGWGWPRGRRSACGWGRPFGRCQ